MLTSAFIRVGLQIQFVTGSIMEPVHLFRRNAPAVRIAQKTHSAICKNSSLAVQPVLVPADADIQAHFLEHGCLGGQGAIRVGRRRRIRHVDVICLMPGH